MKLIQPRGVWKQKPIQQAFLDRFQREVGIKHLDDWYQISNKNVLEKGGQNVLHCYGYSIYGMLSSIYPDHDWMPWKFKTMPHGFWSNMNNRRRYFDWLQKELNLKTFEDWYHVPRKLVYEKGGYGLLYEHYGKSLMKALQHVYPEYTWQPWKFDRLPRGFWNKDENVIQYLSYIAEQYNIKSLTDWFLLSKVDLKDASTLILKHNGFRNVLMKYIPGLKELDPASSKPYFSSTTQLFLLKMIQDIFPGMVIKSNYKHSALQFTNMYRMELDIFIPDLSVAVEYHGEHHYLFSDILGSPEMQQARDSQKRQACKAHGITLVEVPFWWDRRKETLFATLKSHGVPLPHEIPIGTPIPSTMPKSYLSKRQSAPVVPDKWLESFPYRVVLGRSKAKFQKCRGCGIVIGDKTKPRIEMRGVFVPPAGPPRGARYAVCLSSSCLEKALTRYPSSSGMIQIGNGMFVTPFNDIVGISKEAKSLITDGTLDLKHIQLNPTIATEWLDVPD